MSPDNRHPSKTARAKAMLVNSLLLVWVLNAALAIADTALVLANGSRTLSPFSGAMGFVFQGLEATLIWAILWPRGLPRRTLCWMLGAGIVLAVVSSFFLTETHPETITLESMIYWPATDALPGLVARFLSLMIGIAGYLTLRRQCGVTGYYLDARSLAKAEMSGRNFLEILADTQQGRLAYLAKAFLINEAPIFLVIFTVGTLDMVFVDIINLEEVPHEYTSPAAIITGVLLIAPVLETLILWFLISVFRKITGGRVLASAGLAGVTIGLAHLINNQSVGYLLLCLVFCWSFFVQALVFLAWEKHGRWKALVMVAILHALHNTGPAIMGVSNMEPPRPHESNEPVLVQENSPTEPRWAMQKNPLPSDFTTAAGDSLAVRSRHRVGCDAMQQDTQEDRCTHRGNQHIRA
ncbi:MAG: hypothetical protein MK161_17470 [Pirellulales bacterium]|nr:hypothetical protein [Pirellulales bacterium]